MCDVIRLSDRPRSSCSFNGDRFLVKMEQHARYERFSLFDRCNDRTTQISASPRPHGAGEELLLFLFFAIAMERRRPSDWNVRPDRW